MNLGDWANVFTAFFAGVALFFGYYTFSRQKTSSDVEVVLNIFNKINDYWDKYSNKENEQSSAYILGQILVYYETSCFLFNRKIISQDAVSCLSDHIFEVWERLNSDADSKLALKKYESAESTFCEINAFVKSYKRRAR